MRTDNAVRTILKSLRGGHKILICGNGGSAAQADHFAGEMIGVCLPCISLTNPAIITAIANDWGYEDVFAHQVAALGNPGDVLICMTTSGASRNLIEAVKQAGILCIEAIAAPIPSELVGDTQAIQEYHLRWLHKVWIEVTDEYWR